MADPLLKDLLANPERLAEFLAKTLPDDAVTAANIADRLNLLHELDDDRLDLRDLLAGLEHTPLRQDERIAANEALQLAAAGQYKIYAIDARHHRVEPYEADWHGGDCQQVRVTLPQAPNQAKWIWTELGVVKPSDHLLFSVRQVASVYNAVYGRVPTIGRVDLITGARHLDIDRFAPLSIFLAYENASDELPSFYFLEAGSAQGNPEAIYTTEHMQASVHSPAGFSFTPFACANNWYTGGLRMDASGIEPATVFNSVAQLKDGQRHYFELTANYSLITSGSVEVKWPILAQIEASLRVFALAQGMDATVISPPALQDLLGDCARRIYEWVKQPPRSGPSNGYDGCLEASLEDHCGPT
jgi:hypothetical protein